MWVVFNYVPSVFPFLTTEKICAILNGAKCAIMNDKCWTVERRPLRVMVFKKNDDNNMQNVDFLNLHTS